MDEVIVTAKAVFAIWLVLEGEPQPVEVGWFDDREACQRTLDHERIGRDGTWGYGHRRKILRAYCDRAADPKEQR